MRNTLVIGVLLAGGLPSLAEAPLTPKQLEFFEKNIRPVLATQCYSCHSAAEGKDKGGLTLDTRDALRKGGDSGEVIIPGDPKNSLLIKVPAAAGAFYLFNGLTKSHKSAFNTWHH